ncbi:hypothetical protein KFE25_013246 [Diacronema lutheri]|uniref:Uncharacterized protein n=2 Tax=Diacronema lutheri TaxID=2081491 RepID=A0A8J5X7E8_DIALT|nr:hypothetical protein KFE25_013246 [Diacronema lutheri]
MRAAAAGAAGALAAHARSLCTTRSTLPWGHRRSAAVGLSCLAFCAPALVDRSAPARWPLQACVSLMSDHFRTGLPSGWHVADRWLASANVLAQLARARRALPAWQAAVLAATPLCAKLRASTCAARRDYAAYRRWHVAWHVLAALAALLVELAHAARPA